MTYTEIQVHASVSCLGTIARHALADQLDLIADCVRRGVDSATLRDGALDVGPDTYHVHEVRDPDFDPVGALQ